PIPRLAPVTSAFFPASCRSISSAPFARCVWATKYACRRITLPVGLRQRSFGLPLGVRLWSQWTPRIRRKPAIYSKLTLAIRFVSGENGRGYFHLRHILQANNVGDLATPSDRQAR